jgi:ribose 5-phosphate isomerase B
MITLNQPEREMAIACDHGGLALKEYLLSLLTGLGYRIEDLGTNSPDSVDYPDFASRLAKGVAAGRYWCGILVCGTGIGMSMAANRHSGIRAAVCTSTYTARMARAHNDANVLCLGGRVLGLGEAEDITRAFLEGRFEGGRHQQRIEKIDSCADKEG